MAPTAATMARDSIRPSNSTAHEWLEVLSSLAETLQRRNLFGVTQWCGPDHTQKVAGQPVYQQGWPVYQLVSIGGHVKTWPVCKVFCSL